jgi:hypothetical protein
MVEDTQANPVQLRTRVLLTEDPAFMLLNLLEDTQYQSPIKREKE